MNRFAEAVQNSRVDVVPRVVVSGGDGENGAAGSSIMEGLLTLLLSDKLGLEVKADGAKERSPEAERLRNEIRQNLMEKPSENKPKPPTAPSTPTPFGGTS